MDDFYASAPAAPPTGGLTSFGSPAPSVARPAPSRTKVWPWVTAIAGVVVALVAGLVVLVWPHSSGPTAPSTSMARLFGQQTRTQLPQPVSADDCAAAVKAFPKIAADPKARAAFVNGCVQGS